MRNHGKRFKDRNWLGALVLLVSGELATAASITVNTATDDFGSVTTNCSLREAIQTANTNTDFGGCTHTGIFNAAITDNIILPTLVSGGFTLTRVGTDDSNNAGDLDIEGPMSIQGVDSMNSIIRTDTANNDNQRHRLMHVISGTVNLRDLTLRDGVESGSSAGGGLRSEPASTTTLLRAVVTANRAGGNAGGILNRGTMTLNQTLVSNNFAENPSIGGGGIFNSPDASLTLNDSRVLNNIAEVDGPNTVSGGGIYSEGALTLDNTVVDGNLADGRNTLEDGIAQGGGVYAHAGTVNLVQSSVTNNETIGTGARGGGIGLNSFAVDDAGSLIEQSVISFNQARGTGPGGGFGGGMFSGASVATPTWQLTIQDSVISGNGVSDSTSIRDSSGGGLSGSYRILRSTVANNQAEVGGGIGVAVCELINSTLAGNSATLDGGGVTLRDTSDTLRIRSSTIVGNSAGRRGGGIFVGDDNGTPQGDAEIANSVSAGNTAQTAGPDCSGLVVSQGHNLVQSDDGCAFAGVASDQIDVLANLGPAQNNGGPTAGSSLGVIAGMSTREPLEDSPLIDSGNAAGCSDVDTVVLATDQIGRPRAIDGPDVGTLATCDIGAVEYTAPVIVDPIFANGFE